MNIQRTANAGILLTLDGVTILLDGMCPDAHGYPGTPDHLRKSILENPPDIYAYTHIHEDHYDPDYAAILRQAGRVIIGPGERESVTVRGVTVTAIPNRHIGKADCEHCGFVITGSQCLWFMGDSAPIKWRGREDLPKPQVVVGPYAYAIASGWDITQSLGAEKILILHLPPKENDPYGLWPMVLETTKKFPNVHIPDIGEELLIEN